MSFVLGVACELALLLAALAWGYAFGEPVLARFEWNERDLLIGTTAALPPLGFFVWSLKSRLPVFARHRQLLDAAIPRLFAGWPTWQLAAISLCAGVCEEALFRGAMQASLEGRIGGAGAVALVALLFGASHLLSWTYGIIAAVIGAYLGWLFLASGNLLVPVATHAVYDFVGLLYFFRLSRGSDQGTAR